MGRSPLADHYAVDTSHQTVEDMRHLVVLVEDMHRFVVGMLIHRMDNRLLVDRSADKLHWTVDIPVFDSGTLVFDWDIPEQVDNQAAVVLMDLDTVQSSADNQVAVVRRVGNHLAVEDHVEVVLVDSPLDQAVVATTF